MQVEHLSDSDQVRVTIFAGSETDLNRIEGQLRLIGINGLNNTYTTALHGQMLVGQFVQCPTNYRVYERDQNLARSCGASGNDFCQAESITHFWPAEGLTFGPQNAVDGLITNLDGVMNYGDDGAVISQFRSGCWGVQDEALGGGNLCGWEYEWWQVDLSRPREIRSLTLHLGGTFLSNFERHFDIELSNDNITFVKCATDQDSKLQWKRTKPYNFISTHPCVGTARYVRLSGNTLGGKWIELSEVQVYGETLPGTCKCAPGHMLQADLSTCAACAGGKYNNATDSRACADCPADTYSNDARVFTSSSPC